MIKTDNVLVEPVVTEKSVAMTGKYTFKVNPGANKNDVKTAVKKFYGVDVEEVRIITTKPKTRLAGRGMTITKRASAKKAIVTLKDGKTLNFNDFK